MGQAEHHILVRLCLLQQYMLGTPPPAYANNSAVYSQACYNHHMSESSLYETTTTSQGVSERDALREFVAKPGGQRWVDSCHGYGCGTGCA